MRPPARRAAIRPASTRSPASSSVACDAATTVRAAEQPQRRPLGVPGAGGALVDGSRRGKVQLRGERGRGERGAPDQHREHGVRLLRHRRGPAPARRGRLARARRSRAAPAPARRPRSCPYASVQRDQGVADAGERRAGRCATAARRPGPAPRRRRPARARRRPGPRRRRARQLRGPASVPAAPPSCTGSATATATASSAASSTPVSQLGRLEPEGRSGTACWVSVRPAITVPRWRVGERRRARATCAPSSLGSRPPALAQAQHQGGVEHVLAGQPAVQPAGGARASSPAAPRSSATSGITGLPPASAAAADAASTSARSTAAARSPPAPAGAIPAAASACEPGQPRRDHRARATAASVRGRRRARRRARERSVITPSAGEGRGTPSRPSPCSRCRTAGRRRRRARSSVRAAVVRQRGEQRVGGQAPRRRRAGRRG